MDLDTLVKTVLIVGGISQAIRVWQQIITDGKKDKSIGIEQQISPNKPSKIITSLIVAIGLVLFLFGAFNFVYATVNINLSKQECIQGYDPNFQDIVKLCDQDAKSKYQNNYKIGLIVVGISFILSALALFIQNLKTANIFQFALEVVWLSLGLWLIISNL